MSGTGVVKKRMQIGSIAVRMGGIAGVWTAAAHRMKGCASRSMEEAISLMDREGYPTSVLFGIPDFYHRYGYAVVFPSSTMQVPARDLRGSDGPHKIRSGRRDDIGAIRRIYSRYNAGRSGMADRGRDWTPSWRMPRLGPDTERRGGRLILAVDTRNIIRGYAVFDTQQGFFHVSEIGVADEAAAGSLAASLGRRARRADAEFVRFHLPQGNSFGAFCAQFGSTWQAIYPANSGSMGRIIQLDALFQALLPEFTHRVLGLDWKGAIVLDTDFGSVGLNIGNAAVRMARVSNRAAVRVSIPQALLMQLVMGYRSVEDVAREPAVRMSRQVMPTMEALFPRGNPYMYWSDRF